ncbi:MAG: hypothetical protein EPN21_18960 [Methylococcaceae bacterium]|nr:MAG: hypothetical protein EPN21_18960 [Methylococcaceae bacterium]
MNLSFDVFRLYFTPLSPVHIGSGDSYQPTHYVIEDGTLYELDTGGLMAALSNDDRTALLNIVERQPNDEMVKAIQRFFYQRRASLLSRACKRIPVSKGVEHLYVSRVGQAANRESGGKQVINRLEIDRTACYPGSGQPL